MLVPVMNAMTVFVSLARECDARRRPNGGRQRLYFAAGGFVPNGPSGSSPHACNASTTYALPTFEIRLWASTTGERVNHLPLTRWYVWIHSMPCLRRASWAGTP